MAGGTSPLTEGCGQRGLADGSSGDAARAGSRPFDAIILHRATLADHSPSRIGRTKDKRGVRVSPVGADSTATTGTDSQSDHAVLKVLFDDSRNESSLIRRQKSVFPHTDATEGGT